jgi:hypothetical protein
MSSVTSASTRGNALLSIQLRWLSFWNAKLVKFLRHWLPVLFVMAVPAFVAWELQGMSFRFGDDVTNWVAGYMLLTIVWQYVTRKVLK